MTALRSNRLPRRVSLAGLLALAAAPPAAPQAVGSDRLYVPAPVPRVHRKVRPSDWTLPTRRPQREEAIERLELTVPAAPQDAPPLALTALDGTPLRLRDLRGDPVLVCFTMAECPSCERDRYGLQRLYARYGPKGLKVIAAAPGRAAPAAVARHLTRQGLKFPAGRDTLGQAAAFGAARAPFFCLVTPQGRVFATADGPRDWSSDAAAGLVESFL